MWKLFFVMLVFCQLKFGVGSENPSNSTIDCYETNENKYFYFSTKTPYRLIRNSKDGDLRQPTQDCKAKQLWLLSRHGTRNPGEKEMKKMRDELPVIQKHILANHKSSRGSLCQDDLENLKEWKFSANIKHDKFLVREGHKEMLSLAHRLRESFKDLLERPFTNESYKFRYTASERTNSSAIAFAKGMFGKSDYENVYYHEPPEDDTLLRFYKLCKKWKVEVDDNKTATIELTNYEKSTEFNEMIARLTKRLGFTELLSLDQINRMYSMCSYEKAWRPRELSPWCAVFSQHDLEILEYREDLEYYYEDGYGYPINYEQACVALKDVYDSFRGIVTQQPGQNTRGIFYFTHSGTLLKVLARFGLFKDAEAPTHTNRDRMVNRKWRTSLIDAFGSNLALALHECEDKAFYVTAYAQEQAVVLPGCGGEFCRFEDFNNAYGSLTDKCNLDQICKL